MSRSDLTPALLVAMPQTVDPNFRRTVVLVVQHGEDGTFGLVVNRPTDLLVTTLCDTLEMPWNGEPELRVCWGGPVQPDHGWVLVGEGSFDSLELQRVADGIRFTSSPEVLRQVAEDPPDRLRIFLGYAGWAPGQLAHEIRQGAWLVAPVSPQFVFDTCDADLWDEVVRGLGINPVTLIGSQGLN